MISKPSCSLFQAQNIEDGVKSTEPEEVTKDESTNGTDSIEQKNGKKDEPNKEIQNEEISEFKCVPKNPMQGEVQCS